MDLTDREYEILHSSLKKINGCKQIELILDADFAPNQKENKYELNAYRKNSLLAVLVYPLARMFFLNRNSWEDIDIIENDLAKFIKRYLHKMSFARGYLTEISKAYVKPKRASKRIRRK